MFFKKMYEKIENRVKEAENFLKLKIETEASATEDRLKQLIKDESIRITNETEEEFEHAQNLSNTRYKDLDSSLKEIKKLYEEYHLDVLDKMDKAGELIISYENFYESTLSDLSEVFRFVEMLNKRPLLSTDP